MSHLLYRKQATREILLCEPPLSTFNEEPSISLTSRRLQLGACKKNQNRKAEKTKPKNWLTEKNFKISVRLTESKKNFDFRFSYSSSGSKIRLTKSKLEFFLKNLNIKNKN